MLKIAAYYDIRVSQLARANGLRWNSWVYVGQQLVIPDSMASRTGAYSVRRGDTLSGIARRFGTTVGVLVQTNQLASTRIYPGQRLEVAQRGGDGAAQYVVRWGDTLSSIARQSGTTVRAIMSANGLHSTTIYVGQELEIPCHDAISADPDWQSYSNSDYAFEFRYPSTWTLEEMPNLVKIDRGTLRLAIAFQRRGEDVPFPWTGMPAGDFEPRGVGQFLGQQIERQRLVYEGKVKVLTYNAEVGDLLFSLRLDDRAPGDYRDVSIPQAVQAEVDRIVGSFAHTSIDC
jgi:LysM repeat protein